MRRFLASAVLVFGASAALMGQTYTINIFAGVLPPTTNPTQPNAIFLADPEAVLVDSTGNVYITDTNSHKVWMVTPSQTVKLVAGTGATGNPANGKAATTQPLNQPAGLAMDAAGNLYISDRGNSQVYKMDTTGVITLIASQGNGRFAGDGRPAIYAELNGNRQIAIGPDGNLYIADTGNNRIRMVNLTTGIITTVAGSTICTNPTTCSSSGLTGDGGAAVLAQLSGPQGVGFDANGNMFISDTGNSRIREVAAPVNSSSLITTVAGRDLTATESAAKAKPPYAPNCQQSKPKAGQAPSVCVGIGDGRDPLQALLANPGQIAVDTLKSSPTFGGIFFSDTKNNIIRELVVGQSVATVIGTGGGAIAGGTGDNGPAAAASINSPSGLALSPNGNIYFADLGNNRIREFDRTLGVIAAVAGANRFNGDQAALATMFSAPTGVASDAAGNAYIADSGNNRIRKVDASGNVTTLAGASRSCGFSSTNTCGDGGPAVNAGLNNPAGIWVDPTGTTIVFADTGNNRIRKISAGTISTIAGGGTYTADGLPGTLVSLNLNASPTPKNTNLRKFPSVASGDGGQTIYFTDPGDGVVRKILADGTLVTVAGVQGQLGAAGDGGPALEALFNNPTGIAVDGNGNVFVADTGNNTARVISNGMVYPVAGQVGANNSAGESSTNPAYTYRWRLPMGLAVDATGKNLIISDAGNNVVDSIAISTLIATRIAGNNKNTGTTNEFAFNYSGDNVSGSSAQLAFPTGVNVMANGKVLFADSANNMIRVLAPAASK